jgi:hypothetical protein
MGDTRLPDAMADVRQILAAGIDVVGSGLGVLQYPWQVLRSTSSASKMLREKVIRQSS